MVNRFRWKLYTTVESGGCGTKHLYLFEAATKTGLQIKWFHEEGSGRSKKGSKWENFTYKLRHQRNGFSSRPYVRHAVDVAVEWIVVGIVHPSDAITSSSSLFNEVVVSVLGNCLKGLNM